MSETVTPSIIQLPYGKKIKIIKVTQTTKPVLTAESANFSIPLSNNTKVAKEPPPLKLVKGMENSISQKQTPEMKLKTQLIKDFSDSGITFDSALLTAINKFFTGIKSFYSNELLLLTNKNVSLLAEINNLQKTCDEQEAALKVCRDKHKTMDISKVPESMKKIKYLNSRFLKEIEIVLEQISCKEEEQEEKVKDSEVKEVQRCIDFEKIENLVKELASRIDTMSEEEISSCKEQLQKIFLFLLSKHEFEFPDTNIDNITQLDKSDNEMQNQLNADVDMGYVLPNGPAPQLHMENVVFKEKFLPYLTNCTNPVNPDGDRPIHLSVRANDLKEVKKHCLVLKLLRHSVDIFNDNDYTPLHFALLYDSSLEIIQKLLLMGANCTLKDGDGNTLLHIATENSSLKKLLDKSVLDIIGGINIWQGIIDERNNDGYTALHLAVMQNNYDEMQELIDLQAYIDRTDTKSGRTALYYAVENNNVKAVEILLEHNANPHIQTFSGGSIVQVLSESDSDYSPDIKKLFYNDLILMKSTTEEPAEKPVKRKPNGSFGDRSRKRNKHR